MPCSTRNASSAVRERGTGCRSGRDEDRIDKAACVGNARCAAVAADLYPLDEDGYVSIEGFTVPDGQEMLARRGAKACPERIIFVEEDE